MNNLPSISIVTCFYNYDLKLFKKHIDSIKFQEYPKNKIEHIIMDGGSSINLRTVLKGYNANIHIMPKLRDLPQLRMSIGIQRSKHDLVLILEPDNILIGKKWLSQMVQPFLDDREIFCTSSMYNGYNKGMSLISRYCALFGIPDPTLYFLKKSDKVPVYFKRYDKGKIISDNKSYSVVEFDPKNLPTFGDNGHMFRRNVLLKANKHPNKYTHTDAVLELLENGHKRIGIVKNSIIHITESNLFKFAKQRIGIKSKSSENFNKRKYHVFDSNSQQDRINIFLFVILSFTFIVPIFQSMRGYLYKHDVAWFLHPVVCITMVIAYGYSEVINAIKYGKTE